MLDDILNIVKDVATDTISKNADVPTDKKDLLVETSTDAISNAFTSNISQLTDLFSGGGVSSSIMDSIKGLVVDSLVKKVGINSTLANTLVSAMLPAIISAVSGKAGSDSSFDLGSLLGSLGKAKKGDSGGLLGAFEGLFGK